jgi:hypothetical protein
VPGKWEYTQVDNRLCIMKEQGVCHTVALPFTLKRILRQKKKNYGNSNNISPWPKYINLQKKSSKKKPQNPSRYDYNSRITNLKFQHKQKYISSFKNPHIIKNRPIIIIYYLVGAKIP